MTRPITLVYFNENRTLWIDLDASKEFGFGIVVFYVKKDADTDIPVGKWPIRSQIEPIIFLLRLLTTAERNYWPTELEVAGFVWVIKKTRYLVESLRYKVII